MDTNIYNSDIKLYNRDKLNLGLKFLGKKSIEITDNTTDATHKYDYSIYELTGDFDYIRIGKKSLENGNEIINFIDPNGGPMMKLNNFVIGNNTNKLFYIKEVINYKEIESIELMLNNLYKFEIYELVDGSYVKKEFPKIFKQKEVKELLDSSDFIKDEKTGKYKIDVDVYDVNDNHLSSEQVETIINDIKNYNVYTNINGEITLKLSSSLYKKKISLVSIDFSDFDLDNDLNKYVLKKSTYYTEENEQPSNYTFSFDNKAYYITNKLTFNLYFGTIDNDNHLQLIYWEFLNS